LPPGGSVMEVSKDSKKKQRRGEEESHVQSLLDASNQGKARPAVMKMGGEGYFKRQEVRDQKQAVLTGVRQKAPTGPRN